MSNLQPSYNGLDRRIASRYAIQVSVELLFDNGGALRMLTRDVSASGIFISVNKSLQLNDHLRFLITFPEEITTSCKLLTLCDGAIVRREPTEGSEGLAIKITRYHFLCSRADSMGDGGVTTRHECGSHDLN